jgi:hypothetical protein
MVYAADDQCVRGLTREVDLGKRAAHSGSVPACLASAYA